MSLALHRSTGVARVTQRPNVCAAPAMRQRRTIMASLEPKRERASIPETMENMLKRFDFLSAGTGALVVTGYCWSRGQDPLHALSLTLTATVVAVVLNELLFNNDSSSGCQ